jgi:hypothetical protein
MGGGGVTPSAPPLLKGRKHDSVPVFIRSTSLYGHWQGR